MVGQSPAGAVRVVGPISSLASSTFSNHRARLQSCDAGETRTASAAADGSIATDALSILDDSNTDGPADVEELSELPSTSGGAVAFGVSPDGKFLCDDGTPWAYQKIPDHFMVGGRTRCAQYWCDNSDERIVICGGSVLNQLGYAEACVSRSTIEAEDGARLQRKIDSVYAAIAWKDLVRRAPRRRLRRSSTARMFSCPRGAGCVW